MRDYFLGFRPHHRVSRCADEGGGRYQNFAEYGAQIALSNPFAFCSPRQTARGESRAPRHLLSGKLVYMNLVIAVQHHTREHHIRMEDFS